MRTFLAVGTGGVLALLAALHVVWAVGGTVRAARVIPQIAGEPAFAPTRAITFAVAALLALAGWIVLAQGGAVTARSLPPRLLTLACATVGAVFLLRAVGDFRLVGFFRTVTGTEFARLDALLYSPLCVAIGAGALWVALAEPR